MTEPAPDTTAHAPDGETTTADPSADDHTMDETIAAVEEQLAVLYGRVRLLWKDGAAHIHPDLKPVGYKILSTIVRHGETTASVLIELLEIDKAVVSRQLRMLEEIGLVVSRADERDGRSRLLSATPDAIERVRAARKAYQDRLRGLLRSRSRDELTVFASMLRLVAEN